MKIQSKSNLSSTEKSLTAVWQENMQGFLNTTTLKENYNLYYDTLLTYLSEILNLIVRE